MKQYFYKTKYFKILVLSIVLVFVSLQLFEFHQAQADPVVYYFNNAISTSPADLGNYWYDAGFTNPALELPNLAIDELHVVAGAVYDGNAIFNGSGTNEGDITGNATFNENLSEHLGGTISGSKIRRYATASQPARDFRDSPWIVQADDAEVNVSEMIYDDSTTFTRVGTGSFVGQDIFYFNNAVDTSPNELGNYWSDAGCTVQATGLPNFTVDEISIVTGGEIQNTFNGNITFNGAATNDGIVTGNATFNDTTENLAQFVAGGGGIIQGNATFNDSSVNNGDVEGNAIFNDSASLSGGRISGDGTFNEDVSGIPGRGGSILGARIRHYALNTTTTRNFTTEGPWEVQADAAIVDVTGATFNSGTVFTTLNGGSFVFPPPVYSSSSIQRKTLTLTYDRTLDAASIPAAGDYAVLINGLPVSISNVSISGATVVLTLTMSANVAQNDLVIFDYTPGVNPVQTSQGADAVALNDVTASNITTIGLGGSSIHLIAVGPSIYALSGNTVKVIDAATEVETASINVGTSPNSLTLVGTKLYVFNFGSDNVSVINTLTNTVIATISVGDTPQSGTLVGTNLYVNNSPVLGTVSVIDTITDTVTATISVGNSPRSSTLVGTKLYVNNQNSSNVSVIDTTTNTVSATIAVGSQPQNSAAIGTKLYVPSNVGVIKVIDTTTDTVSNTITISGGAFRSIEIIGTTVYATDYGHNEVVAINSLTDTVITTIGVGSSPWSGFVFGNMLAVTNINSANVSIISAETNTLIETVSVETSPRESAVIGDRLFVVNQAGWSMSVIDFEALLPKLPNLVSFSSSTADGTYSTGQSIAITANFARALQAGSTMTVSLNSGASVVLSAVSAGSLSGTYTIAAGESTPDLSVTAITAASITDAEAHARTSYSLRSSAPALNIDSLALVRNLGDVKNIVIGTHALMATGQQPQHISPVVTVGGIEYLYVTNKTDNTVSVIRKSDGVTTATIPVGTEPNGIASTVVNGITYVYVANTGSNSVSVINATTNSVSATITVGLRPNYFELVETKLYVTNSGSHTVSAINTGNNSVVATIPVGLSPRGLQALGTNVYVANYGDQNISGGNSISVINSVTDTVSDTIILPSANVGAYGIAIYNRNLYVTNYKYNTVSVIDADTKVLEATISVGGGPRDIFVANNTVYVSAFDGGTMWAINPATNLETAIITTGHSPMGMSSSGNFLYYARYQDNRISLINLSNNSVSEVLAETTNSGGGGGGGMIVQAPRTETNTPRETETPRDPSTPDLKPTQGPIDTILSNRLKGRLLLAVQDHGKIWYVDPISGQRFQVTLDTAIQVFRRLSLGISNSNLARIFIADSPLRSALGNRLKGRLLLQVENRGLIWYVDQNGLRHAVTPKNVMETFRKLALGITNANLDKIKNGDLN